MRLYLTCSVLYFVMAAAAPIPVDDTNFEVSAGVGFTTGEGEQTESEAAFAKAVRQGLQTLSPDERAAAEAEIAGQPWWIRPMLRAMAVDIRGLQRRVAETMPRLLFVLIPLLAGLLAVFHRGRPYPDHLYFAIHLQAFVFVMATAVTLAQFSQSLIAIATAQIASGLFIVGYALVAQRVVYGGSWGMTVVKTAGVGIVYGVLWGFFSLAATLWASRSI